jgi:BirA family transcriptional regulator, biotin operon repressor / biotin---[acetyl-CoA-carboxylase] ligase
MLLITTLDSTDSTNSYLNNLILNKKTVYNESIIIDVPEYYTVRCNFQTNGRGQKENCWHSEHEKNILLSTLLYPSVKAENQFDINICICLGILDFCKEHIAAEGFTVKWPNDVYYQDKKIGGVLIEHSIVGTSILHTIVGIGLNINQTQFPDSLPNPISAALITNQNYNIDHCVRELLSCVISRYEQMEEQMDTLKEEYKVSLFRMNKPSKFVYNDKEIIASICDVNNYGLLCLKTTDNVQLECGFKEIGYVI